MRLDLPKEWYETEGANEDAFEVATGLKNLDPLIAEARLVMNEAKRMHDRAMQLLNEAHFVRQEGQRRRPPLCRWKPFGWNDPLQRAFCSASIWSRRDRYSSSEPPS